MSDDLLPPNASAFERALAGTTTRIGAVPVPIRDIWSPDKCPPALLAWLAYAFSVDQWSNDWTEAQKREFIRSSLDVHKHKGTIGAVKQALAALSYDAQVQEWFNQTPAGAPFTFQVLLNADQIGVDRAGFGIILSVIERTKNLRSHLSKVKLTVRTQAGPFLVCAASVGSEIDIIGFREPETVINETTISF